MVIPIREAATYIGLEQKQLKNFATVSKEIPFQMKSRRYYFDTNDLDNWINLRESRKVILTIEDYVKCLDFAFRIVYSGHTTSDFGTARQRGKLQAISNWTQGNLAEVALQKFLFTKYNIKISLDFSVHNYITGQDITEVIRNRVANPPRIRVSIKSGKLNSSFIIIPQNEVESNARVSDYYFFVRIDFPEDHLIRALKDHRIIKNIDVIIPELSEITSYLHGYTHKDGLNKVSSIPGQDFEGVRYVRNIGSLKNSDSDMEQFIELL